MHGINIIDSEPIPVNSRCIVYAVTGNDIGHWVAIETSKPPILMDPYGYHDMERYKIPFFKFPNGSYLYNPIQGQKFNTLYCGLYCIAYFKLREHNDAITSLNLLFPKKKGQGNHDRLREILGTDPDILIRTYGS